MPKQPRMQGAGRAPRMGEMQQMLRQLEQVQQDIKQAEESLKQETVEASSGGGMVTVRVSGDLEVRSVNIDEQALGDAQVAAEDLELLCEMVQAAVNEALKSAQELSAEKMEQAAGPLAELGGAGGLGGLGGLGGEGGLGGLL
jgi:nucleoid-associated protein EbfC